MLMEGKEDIKFETNFKIGKGLEFSRLSTLLQTLEELIEHSVTNFGRINRALVLLIMCVIAFVVLQSGTIFLLLPWKLSSRWPTFANQIIFLAQHRGMIISFGNKILVFQGEMEPKSLKFHIFRFP